MPYSKKRGVIILSFTYDGLDETDSAYINVSKGKIHHTHEVNDNIMIDVTKSGKLIGIEILNASENMDIVEVE